MPEEIAATVVKEDNMEEQEEEPQHEKTSQNKDAKGILPRQQVVRKDRKLIDRKIKRERPPRFKNISKGRPGPIARPEGEDVEGQRQSSFDESIPSPMNNENDLASESKVRT